MNNRTTRKNLPNAGDPNRNGRQREVCQGELEVDASSEGQATEMAKLKFCQEQALCDWSLHADRIRIEAADLQVT